jgi:hypothetical protein
MPLRRLVLVVALVATVVAGLAAVAAFGANGDTSLISRAGGADGAVGDDHSGNAAVSNSETGIVAFESDADNLSDDDNDAVRNVYVRDSETGDTELISRASGPSGAAATGISRNADISEDGRFVVFESIADNLSDADSGGTYDIYMRDRQTGATTLLSRTASNGPASQDSFNPAIAGGGRHVAFDSRSQLTGQDNNGTERDVYVRDTEANTTTLVSRASGPGTPAAGDESMKPAININGSKIAFQSSSDGISDDDNDGTGDIYLRDVVNNTTVLVSRADDSEGAAGDLNSEDASISGSGNEVAFESQANNLGGDPDLVSSIYMRRIDLGGTVEISAPTTSGGNAPGDGSHNPSISATGLYVAFDSDADNLANGDSNAAPHAYVRNTQTNGLAIVSRAQGRKGRVAVGGDVAISQSGRHVAFTSIDDTLGETGDKEQVWLRERLNAAGGGAGGPSLGNMKVAPSKFAAAGSGGSVENAGRRRTPVGTTVSFRVDETSLVRFRVQKRSTGRKVGRKCRKATRSNRRRKKCARWTTVRGSFAVTGTEGRNKFRFTGRLRNRKLRPGTYRFVARPADQDGNRGKVRRKKFRIVR